MACEDVVFQAVVQEKVVELVVEVLDPYDLDISSTEIRLTSRGQRHSYDLPVMIWPTHPLNSCRYHRKTHTLELKLRRPFASTTWQMFSDCEKKFADMQAEANRVLGPEVNMGIDVQGEVTDENRVEVSVVEGKGVVVNLDAKEVIPEDVPRVVLGEKEEMFLPWADEVEFSSASSDGEEPSTHHVGQLKKGRSCPLDPGLATNNVGSKSKLPSHRIARQIARQGQRKGLWVGTSQTQRKDGRPLKGHSLFTTQPRKEGELVVHYAGSIIPRYEMLRSPRARRFYFYLDDGYTMDAGTGGPRPHAAYIAGYTNSPSGCVDEDGSPLKANLRATTDPSKGLGPHAILLTATRDISAGEELFYDYGDKHDMTVLSSDSGSEDEVYESLASMQSPWHLD